MSEPTALRLNPNDLTLGDLDDFEDIVGCPLDAALKQVPALDDEGNKKFDAKGRPEMTVEMSTKALIALVFISRRAEDPSFTKEDARKVRISELVIDQGAESESADPKELETALPA